MNHPDFTQLRRKIDEAITFHDLDGARHLVAEGLGLAQKKECPGEAMYFRAQEHIIAGRFEDAIGFLEQALVFNPSDGAAYNDIALCRIETGLLDGTLEIFDKGIAVEEDYATIHHNKGWLLNMLGRSSEALVCFERALALEPNRVVTLENMANAYEQQGRITEALAAYRKALSLLKLPSGDIGRQIQDEIARLSSC